MINRNAIMKDETCFGQYMEGNAECHICDVSEYCQEEQMVRP